MKTKIAIALLIVLAVGGGLAAIKVSQIKTLIAAGASFAPPPEAISSAEPRVEQWQSTLSAIGTITAAQGVTITPDIPGTIREIAFESGAEVETGALLVRLDTSTEEAQLNAIEAQVELARVNLERITTLRKENMISQAELDAAMATLRQNQANGEAIRATIEKKMLRAPFTGRLGIRQVNLGEFLDAGKAVVSLQSLAPIYANFSLPQQELSRLKAGMDVRLKTDAFPDRDFSGKLSAINPALNESTRAIGLQATFENAELLLRPGMFARIEVLLPEQKEVLVIPATAVLSAPYGDSVYIIESRPKTNAPAGETELAVRQQFIRTGPARGDFVAVETGLKPGERVVSAGAFKLRNGMVVVENNDLKPEASSTPKPSDS
jgi:membrane fusion protein, multidrug efflux system